MYFKHLPTEISGKPDSRAAPPAKLGKRFISTVEDIPRIDWKLESGVIMRGVVSSSIGTSAASSGPGLIRTEGGLRPRAAAMAESGRKARLTIAAATGDF